MLMSPVELGSEEGCAGDAGKNWKVQTRLLVRESAPPQQTRNCLKIIKERMGKIGRVSQMGAWHQSGLGRLAVGRNITLTLTYIKEISEESGWIQKMFQEQRRL
jgi:hypothetical protein